MLLFFSFILFLSSGRSSNLNSINSVIPWGKEHGEFKMKLRLQISTLRKSVE